MTNLNKLTIMVVAGYALLLTGCATTKQLNEVRAIAEQAQADAQAASVKSDEALIIANDANVKIDNMFKKAMLK